MSVDVEAHHLFLFLLFYSQTSSVSNYILLEISHILAHTIHFLPKRRKRLLRDLLIDLLCQSRKRRFLTCLSKVGPASVFKTFQTWPRKSQKYWEAFKVKRISLFQTCILLRARKKLSIVSRWINTERVFCRRRGLDWQRCCISIFLDLCYR